MWEYFHVCLGGGGSEGCLGVWVNIFRVCGYAFYGFRKSWVNIRLRSICFTLFMNLSVKMAQFYLLQKSMYSWVPKRHLSRAFLFQSPPPSTSPVCLLIIRESFQPRRTFWNNILMLTFLWSCKKSNLSVVCFVL